MFEKGIAIVTLTKWGLTTSLKLSNALEKTEIKHKIFAPRQLCSDRLVPFDENLQEVFAKLFHDFDAIIAVMAVGIVVRTIAPLITSKKTDPAVVVVDDLGKYAISLLSGHTRGANKLTKIIAKETGSIPIITTATELLQKKTVEEIAQEHDLKILNYESLTLVNSAIVNERKILLAAIGGVTCPEIENTDAKHLSNIDQLKEIMKCYDAAIILSPTILPLDGITKPAALLITKPTTQMPAEKNYQLES